MTVWTVPGAIVRVIDADSLRVNLDLGWNVWRLNASVRLSGLDAPELSTPEGKAARAWVVEYLGLLPAPCTVVSHSLDKYGRVLASVLLASGDLGAMLVAAGQAHPWSGEGPRP